MEHVFRREVWLSAPVKEVFEFFSDAKNLERITPPWLNFRILSQSTPHLQEGTVFEYRLKIHGLPVRWKSRIESWNFNQSFVDTQVKGPYSLWHHTHYFESRDQGTQMVDVVRYRIPFGLLGHLLLGVWVKKDIHRIFQYRERVILSLFDR